MLYTIYRETDPNGVSQPCSGAKLVGYTEESFYTREITKQYWNIEVFGLADLNKIINEVKHPVRLYQNVLIICDK